MAKIERPSRKSQEQPTPSGANEALVSAALQDVKDTTPSPPAKAPSSVSQTPGPKPTIGQLAVDALPLHCAETTKREALVRTNAASITLADAELLMRQAKVAQTNATELLNRLKKYRKAVSDVLETRRKEQADAKRKSVEAANPVSPVVPISYDKAVDQAE